jgi:biotin operon repressor
LSKILKVLTRPIDDIITALEVEERAIQFELRTARSIRAMVNGGKTKKSPNRRIKEREAKKHRLPTGPTQKAICELLAKRDTWTTGAEIAKALGKTPTAIYQGIRPLLGTYILKKGRAYVIKKA